MVSVWHGYAIVLAAMYHRKHGELDISPEPIHGQTVRRVIAKHLKTMPSVGSTCGWMNFAS